MKREFCSGGQQDLIESAEHDTAHKTKHVAGEPSGPSSAQTTWCDCLSTHQRPSISAHSAFYDHLFRTNVTFHVRFCQQRRMTADRFEFYVHVPVKTSAKRTRTCLMCWEAAVRSQTLAFVDLPCCWMTCSQNLTLVPDVRQVLRARCDLLSELDAAPGGASNVDSKSSTKSPPPRPPTRWAAP